MEEDEKKFMDGCKSLGGVIVDMDKGKKGCILPKDKTKQILERMNGK